MTEVLLKGRILAWGNSFGVRLTRSEVEAAGLLPGQEVSVRVDARPARVDLSALHFFHGGAGDVSARHDEYLAEDRLRRWRRRQRAPGRRH